MGQYIATNPDLRDEIWKWSVKLYDHNSPTVKARCARCRQEFLDILRGALVDRNSLTDSGPGGY